MGMIGQLIGDFAQFVPTWVLVLLLAVVGVLALPGWLLGLRVKRIKSRIRRVTRASGEEREALLTEAWLLAEGKPEALVSLAREADKMNLPGLRDRALDTLREMGTHDNVLRKLEAPKNPMETKRQFGHPVEASVSIGRLLDNGATEAARDRLAEALARFPDDEGLLELQERLATR